MSHTLYAHVNKINGKSYIGQTCSRIDYRSGRNGNSYMSQTAFSKAIKKYGWDNFEHIVLATDLTQEEVDELEIQFIKELRTCDHRFGYNMQTGGKFCNYKLTQETKDLISKNKGKHASSREPLKEDTKRKISEAHKKRYKENINCHWSRPLIVIDSKDMTIKKYNFRKDIIKELGVSHLNYYVDKNKSFHGRYYFRTKYDPNEIFTYWGKPMYRPKETTERKYKEE